MTRNVQNQVTRVKFTTTDMRLDRHYVVVNGIIYKISGWEDGTQTVNLFRGFDTQLLNTAVVQPENI